jgi:hypothetical protein
LIARAVSRAAADFLVAKFGYNLESFTRSDLLAHAVLIVKALFVLSG